MQASCAGNAGVLTPIPSFMAFFNQQTLAKSASLTGTSLHTGAQVSLRLRPAPVDHGIKFKRMDLPDEPTIDAKIEHVKFVERATTIAEGNVKVYTVEHVLSALYGMGVDNALVEMDSNEPPIGDGSAYPYVELINKCGIERQSALRRTLEVLEPLHIENHVRDLRKRNRSGSHVRFLRGFETAYRQRPDSRGKPRECDRCAR